MLTSCSCYCLLLVSSKSFISVDCTCYSSLDGGNGGPPGGGPPGAGAGGCPGGGGGGPPGGGGPFSGGGCPGGGVGGGAPSPPLPYTTAAQFIAILDNTPTNVERQNLEQIAIARGTPEVQLAAMAKYNLRLQTLITTMAGQVTGATAAAALANANAANAQIVAQTAEMWIVFVRLRLPSTETRRRTRM
jgi:hypothetical protein